MSDSSPTELDQLFLASFGQRCPGLYQLLTTQFIKGKIIPDDPNFPILRFLKRFLAAAPRRNMRKQQILSLLKEIWFVGFEEGKKSASPRTYT